MMPWRTYQRVRTIAIHLRDLGVLFIAMASLAGIIWLVA